MSILGSLSRAAKRMPLLRTLDARGRLLSMLPSGGKCAEIGVWKGDFTRRVLLQCRPIEYHLIDPWRFQVEFPDRWYGGAIADGQTAMDQIHKGIVDEFGALPNVTIHRAGSTEAVHDFADGSLDWIYIDGDHSYDAVRADLELYLPKIRPGGLLAGDDYYWGGESLPVKRAVDEFTAAGHAERVFLQGGQFALRTPD